MEVVDRIEALYSFLDEDQSQAELDRRKAILSGLAPGIHHLDSALLANRFKKRKYVAVGLLEEAVKDPDLAANPFVHALLGRVWLSKLRIEEATTEYETAMSLSLGIGNPALIFRVRVMYADDFFDRNKIDLAYDAAYPALVSEYPIERAWALSQKALYDWSRDATETAVAAYTELKDLWPKVSPREDFDWQRRRYEDIEFTLKMIERTLSEDPVAEIMIAVEALDYNYRAGRPDIGMKDIRAVVEKYPIEDYPTWTDPELRDWLVWAHYNYRTCLYLTHSVEESEAALEKMLAIIPFEDYPARVVDLWFWLAQTRNTRGDEVGALEAYERGLDLDVSHLSPGERPQFPTDRFQQKVKNAALDSNLRWIHSYAYEKLLKRVEDREGGPTND